MIAAKLLLGNSGPEFHDIEKIREGAFVEGDGFDKYAVHALVYSGGEPCAAGRLYHDNAGVRLDRICVLPERRGAGLGDLVTRLLLYKASASAAVYIDIDVEPGLSRCFEKFGFKSVRRTDEGVSMRLDMNDLKFPAKCREKGPGEKKEK